MSSFGFVHKAKFLALALELFGLGLGLKYVALVLNALALA